jgi:hypothetical protein
MDAETTYIDAGGRLPVVKAPPCNEQWVLTLAADGETPVGILKDGVTFKVIPAKRGRIHLDRGETHFVVVHHAPFMALRVALAGYCALAESYGIPTPEYRDRWGMPLSEVTSELVRLEAEVDKARERERQEVRRAAS